MFRHVLLGAVLLVGCSESPTAPSSVSQHSEALEQRPEEAFRDWLSRYLSADQVGRAELEASGVRLAELRRTSFRALLLDDPQTALAIAVNPVERAALPASIARFVEQWRDGIGTLHVIAATSDEGAPLERFVTFNAAPDEVLRAGVFGERLGATTRENVRLHGVALDGAIALSDSRLRRLFPGEPLPPLPLEWARACPVSKKKSEPELTFHGGDTLYGFCIAEHASQFDTTLALGETQAAVAEGLPPAAAWAEGPKSVLYVRVDFSDRTGDPVALNTAQTMIDTNTNQVYQSNSYGKTSLSATVTPTLRLPKTRVEYQTNDQYLLLRSDALAVARDAGFDPNLFDRDVIAFASTYSGWAGRGYVGGKGTWLNGDFSLRVTGHELGHNYGVNHANYWNSTGLTVIGPGSNTEYGNPYDIMGGGGGQANHFNAWFKKLVGWLPPSEIAEVTTSTTVRLTELEKPTTGLHTARIVRDAQKDYWLEYRPAINTPHTKDGISLNWGYAYNTGSHLLDVTPGDGSRNNATLIIGRTFSDRLAGVHITPIAKGGTTPESIDVVVNLGTFPGNRAPTLTLTASTLTATSGQNVTFTATASDPDGDALAYAWDFDDGTWGPNAPTVTRAFTAAREYAVQLTVSDMKGATVTRRVLITVGTPTTFTLSGTVLQGATPLEGVRISDGTRATITAADGTYALTNVPAGSFTITAAKVDYSFTRSFAAPLTVAASQSALDFTAAPIAGYALRGKVTFNTTNIAGVTISDGTRTATTNGSGDYVLTGVPTGRYTLTASKPGWYFVPVGFSNPVEVYGGDVSALNFSGNGQTLYGSIPMAGVATAPVITDGVRSTTATANGSNWNYYLSGVPNGAWTLVASSPGVTLTPSGFTNPVTVQGAGRGNLNFAVTAGSSANVSGTVRTGTTPLPNVVVSDGTRSATTDSLGQYTLVGVPAGTYTLTPTFAGYSFMPASLSVTVGSTNVTGKDFATTVVNLPPTIVTPGAASPQIVTGATTQLSILGADDGGESALTYTWNTNAFYPVTFSTNGTNAAKSTTVTFTGAGTFSFECTVSDAGGLSVRSALVVVTVKQTSTGLDVTPATATVSLGGTQNFQANLRDQFARNMYSGSPAWSVSGGGTVPATGFFVTFTAGLTPGGPFVLTTSVDGRTATALVTVAGSGTPMITAAASATPNPVAGTTAQLAVRATDDGGERALVYRWSAVIAPAPVTFSANDDNAAKDTTVTFTAAGSYTFVVTVVDALGNTATNSLDVTVQATPTTLTLQPTSVSLRAGQTQAFTASASDQFGALLTPQPALTWAVSGGGTVDGDGLFTAGATPGGPHTLTVTGVGLSATGQLTITAAPDIVPPTISITQPSEGARLLSPSTIVTDASDDVEVTEVEFFVDGATSLGTVTSAPFSLPFDFSTLVDGAHVLTARARDAAGNATLSAGVSIVTGPGPQDVAAPVVQLTAPAEGAITPLDVQLAAEASDDVGVTSLRFELDGAVVATLTSPPWTLAMTLAAGEHRAVAVAFDAAGKSTRSSEVRFTAQGEIAPEPTPVEPERVLGGCGCTSTDATSFHALVLLLGLALRTRRR
jgi:uncharacterized protein (TIGR03382 family)